MTENKVITMNKPYIICHMAISIDGKVTGDFLYQAACKDAIEEYYRINREYKANAYACGRTTMEGSFTDGWYPDLTEFSGVKIPKEDYVAPNKGSFFAVAFDRHGKLGWKTSKITDDDPGYGNAHIIEVLSENVDDAYLAYLKSVGISYIFAGKNDIDIKTALDKLYSLFEIKTLLLEGGSIINGAFHRENVIDELSLVSVPLVADSKGKPLFFDSKMQGWEIKQTAPLKGGALWINYKNRNYPFSS